MRWMVIGLVMALSVGQSFAQNRRAACPSNAEQAGYSLWPPGSLRPGETKRGTHACGRRISCTGARLTDRNRACRWL